MKKSVICLLAALALLLSVGGCANGASRSGGQSAASPAPAPADQPTEELTDQSAPPAVSDDYVEREGVDFAEGQLYAVAHLGYQNADALDDYAARYLGGVRPPVHYVSDGDFYLVIPRYAGMALSLLVNDMETGESRLRFEDPDCEPFVVQCNVSDIFPDVTIQLDYQDQRVEFSPFLSLENGDLDVGDAGLDLTEPPAPTPGV